MSTLYATLWMITKERESDAVDCDACGPYTISMSAIQLLKLKPEAKGCLREKITSLRSESTPRPLIQKDMVDWCALDSQLK